MDVNQDNAVSARDALLVINELNLVGTRSLTDMPSNQKPDYYLDTTGDNFLSARDALLVINHLGKDNTGAAAVAKTTSDEVDSVYEANQVDSLLAYAAQAKYAEENDLLNASRNDD